MEATRIAELRRYQANSRRIQTWSVRGLIVGIGLDVLEEFDQQLRGRGRR